MNISSASSMPNLDQMNDCDPDYNVTLTPDMYSGLSLSTKSEVHVFVDMRQAMTAAHPMEGQAMAALAQNPSPTSPTADRPTFYIESTKHKFAVTTFEKFVDFPEREGERKGGGVKIFDVFPN